MKPPEVRNFRGLHHAFRLLGTSQITPRKVSDASSLLTSLRTVSGSIGSAFFAMPVTSLLRVAFAIFGPDKAKPC